MIKEFNSFLTKNRDTTHSTEDISWIDDLPKTNVLAAMSVILQKLSEILDSPLEPSRLKKILLVDEHCRSYVNTLERQYAVVQKMHADLDQQMWNAVCNWYQYISNAYQAHIDGYIDNPEQTNFQHQDLPLIVARALHNQTNLILWRYMKYSAIPEQGWLSLHKLYELAEGEGFAETPVKLYGNLPEIKVSKRYVETLLMDTINHNNMTKLQIRTASDWLKLWVEEINLTPDFDPDKFCFFVNLKKDHPARLTRHFEPSTDCRYWETYQIANRIKEIRQALEQGASPSAAGLSGGETSDDAIDILNQMISVWSPEDYIRQRRKAERIEVNVTATVSHGFSDVWQRVREMASTNRHFSHDADEDKPPRNSGPIILFVGMVGEHWTIRDESQLGFGAMVEENDIPWWTKPGRLIALISKDRTNEIAIGEISSVRNTKDEQVQIGIEVITRNGISVQVYDRTTQSMPLTQQKPTLIDPLLTSSVLKSIKGIMVPANKTYGTTASILLPSSDYNASGQYEVKLAGSKQVLQLGKLMDQKDDWVRVELLEETVSDEKSK